MKLRCEPRFPHTSMWSNAKWTLKIECSSIFIEWCGERDTKNWGWEAGNHIAHVYIL